MYGTRQGPIQWERFFEGEMKAHSFKRLISAPSTYYRSTNDGETIAATHVDDIASASSTTKEGDSFEGDIASRFQYKKKDLGKKTNMLGAMGQVPDLGDVTLEEPDYALLYAYALVTGQVAKELKVVEKELEGLFGRLDEDAMLLT